MMKRMYPFLYIFEKILLFDIIYMPGIMQNEFLLNDAIQTELNVEVETNYLMFNLGSLINMKSSFIKILVFNEIYFRYELRYVFLTYKIQ